MEVKKDAFYLLAIIYKKPDLGSENIVESTRWDNERVFNAIKYLEQEGLIDYSDDNVLMSGERISLRCSSNGINIIENARESQQKYGIKFEVNFITNINLESLIKADIGSIFKVSLF